MTRNQLTRKRLEKIQSWRDTYGAGSNVMLPAEEAEELARIALAAMDGEPVAWTWQHLKQWHVTNDEERARDLAWDGVKIEPLYRHAQQPVVLDGLIKAVEFYEQVKRENPPVETGAWKDAVDWVLKEACRAAMLQGGNSPVIPDGYVMVPMRLTAENGAKGALSGEFTETKFVNCPECFGDDECETCDGSGRIEITVPVTWTTIKEIWAKGVEHFVATPAGGEE